MVNLDSLNEIKEIDKQNVLGSVDVLPDQCLHAWEEANKIDIPGGYKGVKNVIMCGMGGSGLGARVVESVYFDDIKLPFIRLNDYDLPKYVSQDSLVVCSSYSGNTEEVVSNAWQAQKVGAKWLAITTGGKLLELAEKSKVPFYEIKPKYNPSDQPRIL